MERKNLLIASSNTTDVERLESVFEGVEEIRLYKSVTNGADALDTIFSRDVDVLLLDLLLPEHDGVWVLDRLAACAEDQRPLVFVLTALSDDRLLSLIKDRIVYCFIKPLKHEIVLLRVLELLRTAERDAVSADPSFDLLEDRIAAGVRAVGVPAHLKGYYYLRDAIRIYALSENRVGLSVTNDVYPTVAKIYNTRAPLVEHAIRNAIEIAWTRGNLDVIHDYFGYTINDKKGKPSNLEFIAMMAERASRYGKRR